jgi:DNA-binding NarL/FixJ family response regulator
MTAERIRVVLADDHPIVLRGLQGLLKANPNLAIVAACADGDTALSAIRRHRPDVAVIDVNMPGRDGIDLLRVAVSESLPTRIVFLTGTIADAQIRAAVAIGLHGLMLKDSAPDVLIECLVAVAAGRRWLPPDLVRPALEAGGDGTGARAGVLSLLTCREQEIVQLVAEGLSNKDIGRRLSLTEGTVKVHLHNIYEKLPVANRTSLAAFALRSDADSA